MPWWPRFPVLHPLLVRAVGTRLRKSVTPSFRARSYFSACLQSLLPPLFAASCGSVTASPRSLARTLLLPYFACPLLIIAFTGVCRGVGPFRSFPATRCRPLAGPLSPYDRFLGVAAVAVWAVAAPGRCRGFMSTASAPQGMQFFRPFFRWTYGSLPRDTTGFLPCWLMGLPFRFALLPAAGLRPWT